MPTTPEGDHVPDSVALLMQDDLEELTTKTRELIELSRKITKANAPPGAAEWMQTREAVSSVVQSLLNVAMTSDDSAGEETMKVLEGVALGIACFAASMPDDLGDTGIDVFHGMVDGAYARALPLVPKRVRNADT
jgi:hypothetical protein